MAKVAGAVRDKVCWRGHGWARVKIATATAGATLMLPVPACSRRCPSKHNCNYHAVQRLSPFLLITRAANKLRHISGKGNGVNTAINRANCRLFRKC